MRNGCFGSLADATARLIEGPLSPLKADMLNISVNVHKVPTADIAPKFVPSLPNEPSIGALLPRKGQVVQCPNEPNVIVAITSTETRKGEVGVSRFIPTQLICPFFDEPFFA